MHTRTKELTQAAFSTVVSVVILALGFQLTFGEYFWYFCACIALSIPVSNRWKVCCFVTVSALSIMLCPSYLYLCSYILWLGPYALIQCATESMPGVLRFFIRYVCFLAGLLLFYGRPLCCLFSYHLSVRNGSFRLCLLRRLRRSR